MVATLILAGADPSIVNNYGKTASEPFGDIQTSEAPKQASQVKPSLAGTAATAEEVEKDTAQTKAKPTPQPEERVAAWGEIIHSNEVHAIVSQLGGLVASPGEASSLAPPTPPALPKTQSTVANSAPLRR